MREWSRYVRERLPRLDVPPEREAEIVEELAQQLDEQYRRALSGGADEAQALARAEAEIGDWPALAASLSRADQPLASRVALRAEALGLLRELRFAARSLRRSPLFTAVAVLTLALGIGATTAVFSLVDGVLLRPLPYAEPDRLAVVQVAVRELAKQYPLLGVNPRSLLAWKERCRTSCAGLAAIASASMALTGKGEPEMVRVARVSPEIFDVLGVAPALGRGLRAEEAVPGRERVALLSDGLWRARFGADPAVLGRTLTLDGNAYEVVGVLPAALRFPSLSGLPGMAPNPIEPGLFLPLAFDDVQRRSAGEYNHPLLLRLAPGATLESARAELHEIQLAEFADAPVHPEPRLRPLAAEIASRSARTLWLLLGAAAAALLVACVNLAHLLSARWQARRRELAIRTAVGAGTARLAGQVLAETALLAGAGGALGVFLAWASLQAFLAAVPADIPRLAEVALDLRVLGFAAAATSAAALGCALVPALRSARSDPGDTLKAGAHSTGDGARWARARSSLIALESALTAALLVVGGLLLSSFVRVARVERGFDVERLVAFDLALPASRYPAPADRTRFHDRLLAALQASPGVERAAFTLRLPLEGERTVDSIIPTGDTRPFGSHEQANHLQVSPAYFETLGMRLVRGRLIAESDRPRPVAVISERTARAVWPGQDPIGQVFVRSNRDQGSWEVVGVVREARIHGLERDAKLVAYVPYWTGARGDGSVVVRTRIDAQAAADVLRAALAGVDPEIPLQRLRSMENIVDGALAGRRFQMLLTGAFAAAGLLLAAIGVYGVVATSVERRRPELAVRLALGARGGEIIGLVVRQGLRPVAAGLVVGQLAAVAIGFGLRAVLFEVSPYDPLVLLAAAVLVCGISALACLLPAAKAARTSPLLALRGL